MVLSPIRKWRTATVTNWPISSIRVFPRTTSWRWCISFTTNTTFARRPPSASSGKPSSTVTYRVYTPKLAPSCSFVPNATRQQGSCHLKRSTIRQHENKEDTNTKVQVPMHCHYFGNTRATRYVRCRPEICKQCGLSGGVRVSGMDECPQR
jgi:hypothetical protein